MAPSLGRGPGTSLPSVYPQQPSFLLPETPDLTALTKLCLPFCLLCPREGPGLALFHSFAPLQPRGLCTHSQQHAPGESRVPQRLPIVPMPAVIHPVYKMCPLPACLQGMRPGRISSVGGGEEVPWVHGRTPVRGRIPPWNGEVAGASRVSTGVDAPGECWGQREVLVSVYLGRA